MTNSEKIKELRMKRAEIDEEIRYLENRGRLVDYTSGLPIEFIRVETKEPYYERKCRDVWRSIADICKHIFVRKEPIYLKNTIVAANPKLKFSQLTSEEMQAAGALASELVEVYNKHFKQYNGYINVDGNTKSVIDIE